MSEVQYFGMFPIATIGNLDRVLELLGVKPWSRVVPDTTLEAYRAGGLSPSDQRQLDRYAPGVSVMSLRSPAETLFTGFRAELPPWVTTLAILPHEGGWLVPITAEYMHGFDKVVLVPPSGGLEPEDGGDWANAARREFESEVGIRLPSVIPLAGGLPQGAQVRSSTGGMYPFLGLLRTVEYVPTKPDADEHLKVFMIWFDEWAKVVSAGLTNNLASSAITFFAMNRLRALGIDPLTR